MRTMILLVLTVLAEVLALVLRFTARKAYAAWALGLGTLPALIQMTGDFSQGARRGAAMTRSDAQFLAAELAILALALLSLWRFGRWCFWLGWTLNLALIGVFVYLAFFWHPFS
jgi:hypothetical protein